MLDNLVASGAVNEELLAQNFDLPDLVLLAFLVKRRFALPDYILPVFALALTEMCRLIFLIVSALSCVNYFVVEQLFVFCLV